ncbi:uncharacterized protein LOC127881080 isoform X1 [Dreissena polymorpha]|uniref:uncharacterized protein LOC127881080 isoform X1 n=1 Tax=Dreissena polymorpha TaxID=45954 RepID=UPI002265208C|nr:uncharacterized protein LOC127881080 isoform X1 [Dreissena polymorpha]
MRGRPPLCLRCMQLGHVGRDCPGKVIRPTVSLSVGKQASEVAKPVEDTGSVSTWTDVVRNGKKAKKAPETQDAAPATSPPGDQTPSPVTSEMPVVETKEMEDGSCGAVSGCYSGCHPGSERERDSVNFV